MVLFVGQAQVTLGDTVIRNEIARETTELQKRATICIMPNPDLAQAQAGAKPQPHGLSCGLLGGETSRQKVRWLVHATEILKLTVGQYPAHETLAETLKAALHADHAHDVCADTEDHLCPGSHISRFISRTASAMPVKIARATIA